MLHTSSNSLNSGAVPSPRSRVTLLALVKLDINHRLKLAYAPWHSRRCPRVCGGGPVFDR
jgi:hypothetical protein